MSPAFADRLLGARVRGAGSDTRLVALDVARFLAIAGMIAQHTGSPWPVALGFPSALFAVLSGMTAVLSTRRYVAEGRPGAARASVAARGAAVLVIGVVLAFIPGPAVVVLLAIGLSLLVASPLVTFGPRVLVPVAVAFAVVTPIVTMLLFGGEAPAGPMALLLRELLAGILAFPYPLGQWVAFVLVGMAVARVLERRAEARTDVVWATVLGIVCCVLAGAVAQLAPVFASWEAALIPFEWRMVALGPEEPWLYSLVGIDPHAGGLGGTVLFASVSVAVVLGLHLMLGRARRGVLLAIAPLTAPGRIPLTVYVVHVVVLAATVAWVPGIDEVPWGWVFVAHVALAVLLGLAVALTGRRGPLEALVSDAAAAATKGRGLPVPG